jgi:thiol-disulfide isomerase/thioredoxin
MAPTAGLAAKWVPRDFTEASQIGGCYSILAWGMMLAVFVCELGAFMTSTLTSRILLDKRDGDLYQINLDVDMYEVDCRNLRVICISQSNDEPIDLVSQEVFIRPLDKNRRPFGKPRKANDGEDLEAAAELLAQRDEELTRQKLVRADGEEELNADWLSSHDGFRHNSFDHVIKGHNFTFINFFATWCSHCVKFSPMWGEVAKMVNGDEAAGQERQMFSNQRVQMVKMNCVDFGGLCRQLGIDAYPMLRLYKADGTFSNYQGRRHKEDLLDWITTTVKARSGSSWDEQKPYGCSVKGYLQLPRVPGHLEIMAGGGDQDLDPKLTNVSHRVKHLSFSDPQNEAGRDGILRRWLLGPARELVNSVSPMDGRNYLTQEFHEAWIHEFKVVSTISSHGLTTYQFSHQHRLSKVVDFKVPQAQFHFDFEPYSIYFEYEGKQLYEFCTSMMALVGGTYATMRLMTMTSLGLLLSMYGLKPAPRGHSTLDGAK